MITQKELAEKVNLAIDKGDLAEIAKIAIELVSNEQNKRKIKIEVDKNLAKLAYKCEGHRRDIILRGVAGKNAEEREANLGVLMEQQFGDIKVRLEELRVKSRELDVQIDYYSKIRQVLIKFIESNK